MNIFLSKNAILQKDKCGGLEKCQILTIGGGGSYSVLRSNSFMRFSAVPIATIVAKKIAACHNTLYL